MTLNTKGSKKVQASYKTGKKKSFMLAKKSTK
jgi:hypothetical protein